MTAAPKTINRYEVRPYEMSRNFGVYDHYYHEWTARKFPSRYAAKQWVNLHQMEIKAPE